MITGIKRAASPPHAALAESNLSSEEFLARIASFGRFLSVKKKQRVFSQGDPADAVFYIRKGQIRISIASKAGKEATIALVGPGQFLGEESLHGKQSLRSSSAAALTDSLLFRIESRQMLKLLRQEPALSEMFVGFLLERNLRIQDELASHLFNSTEKRLARALLTLAQYGNHRTSVSVVPKISQEALASMVGTTRSRVNMLMARFKSKGLIHYDGELKINSSLLSILLKD